MSLRLAIGALAFGLSGVVACDRSAPTPSEIRSGDAGGGSTTPPSASASASPSALPFGRRKVFYGTTVIEAELPTEFQVANDQIGKLFGAAGSVQLAIAKPESLPPTTGGDDALRAWAKGAKLELFEHTMSFGPVTTIEGDRLRLDVRYEAIPVGTTPAKAIGHGRVVIHTWTPAPTMKRFVRCEATYETTGGRGDPEAVRALTRACTTARVAD